MMRVPPSICGFRGSINRRRFGRYVLGSAIALSGLGGRAVSGSVPERRVFAHYMVCCPAAGHRGTVEDFRAEILRARLHGIDGFALNCGGWESEPYYRNIAARIFEAATVLGGEFTLFFSADGLSVDETVAMVSEFHGHPAMYRYAGRPVLSAFAGNREWADAVLGELARTGKPVGFVPFIYPRSGGERFTEAGIAELISEYPDLEGFFYFGAAGTGEDVVEKGRRIARAWRRVGVPYMASVTPYYRGYGRNNRLFETRGFESMAMEWEAAIAEDAQWVEIVTWNDWNESTYVSSFGPATTNASWDSSWGPLLSHEAYLAASEYYIRWFKTGVRWIKRDDLFWFYRLAPKAVPGLSELTKGNLGYPANADSLLDRVFITAFLTAPALLRIDSGEHGYEFPLIAGIHHVSVGFWLGLQKFELIRNSRIVLAGEGAFPIGTENSSNFNYLSGRATMV
jgi:glucan endo-1,3-alpha-glucosidase